jgi:hypothetical protein
MKNKEEWPLFDQYNVDVILLGINTVILLTRQRKEERKIPVTICRRW